MDRFKHMVRVLSIYDIVKDLMIDYRVLLHKVAVDI